MKARSVKLKEAHKNNNDGATSICSIIWDIEAQYLITSSTSDSSISIHDYLLQLKPPNLLRHHKEGVSSLVLSPDSTCLASGSLDHSVKLFSFPGGEFQTNVTRFTLPIRALAFNKSGTMLAAAGDDEGIKLINTTDGSIARVLKGHKGPITGIGFDPNSDYLASIDSVGTVIYWDLCNMSILYTLENVAPYYGTDTSILNVLGWSPDGNLLAVPGLKNDVVMYDRDTSEKVLTLRGDHIGHVCFLSWSPNGKYMATSGLDNKVLIWDVDTRQDISCQKFDSIICSMAWKPNGNALAVIDVNGMYGVWESPVPSSMKSPSDGAPNLKSESNGLIWDDEDNQGCSVSGSVGDGGESISGEIELVGRKRLRKQHKSYKALGEDSDDDDDLLLKIEPRKRTSRIHRASDDVFEEVTKATSAAKSKLQDPFQPGCTPGQDGKRRFLCYNMIGSITTIENDGKFHVETDFHDTSTGPRVPSMTDHYGYTMASLNENGSVFASPCKADKNMSTLMYRPFSSWAYNSEWSMRFEGEEVKVVALGTGWVAAITNLNILRIFTEGGLQKHILCLDGPVVTASGFKDELAVVTHASGCLPSNDQVLEFRLFNISHCTQPFKGHLPLTPGSHLTWLGYSEEGQLSSFDSKGVLRVFNNQFGGSWYQLFSPSKDKSEESYWIVGLNASKMFCVVCKYPDSYPLVTPKPVLTLLNLSFPLASSDLGKDDLENEFILSNSHLSRIQRKIDEMAAKGQDTTLLDDEAFTIEASLDRCIFRLISACCEGDKLLRATELVKLLSSEKSVKGAIKLVTVKGLPVLAERFNSILEERMLNETLGAIPSSSYPTSKKAEDITCVPQNRRAEPELQVPPPKLPSPSVSKQAATEVGAKLGEDRKEPNGISGTKKIALGTNPFLKGPNDKVGGNKTEEINPSETKRPSNPFAKSSKTDGKATLFDSFKKKSGT